VLKDFPTHTTLPCQNRDRAKAWYAEKLGITPTREDANAVTYEGPEGSRFILFTSGGTASGTHTQMGWRVRDVEAEVRELKGRGVVFEEYDFPGFDKATSVGTAGSTRGAWFKDSEGNLLGLVTLG
jgi:catechol 2,3-dioxygenase-like lactoylglutathione lyase family enzyme